MPDSPSTPCGFRFDTTYTTLPQRFFSKTKPDPAPSPHIILLNHALAETMGLDFSTLSEQNQAALFSGNQWPDGATPFAQAYAGHQYGHFTLLGDGRAHLWGEHISPKGTRFDIQFKGSGPTPYSRRGDGKATLGPMLREYVISEAMHHLRIPTTRSLAVVTTGQPVMRETLLPGAMLTRVASSHIRVGTFEFAANPMDKSAIEALMNHTIKRHYPDLAESRNQAIALLQAVMERQASLIVHWMRVGFIHGVMNTDNMALSGETIDYGPCAFMDHYHPNTVYSSIDHTGRYAYANQPIITQWNLSKLAQALLPLIDPNINKAAQMAEETIRSFSDVYQSQWQTMMCAKLGLFSKHDSDDHLIADLLEWMQKNHADYTNTFRDLSNENKPTGALYQQKSFEDWYQRWQARLQKNTQSRQASLCLMRKNNPAVIPRNHKVEQALNAAYDGDIQPVRNLLEALKTPYQDRHALKPYQAPPNPNERINQTFCGT